MPFTVQGVLAKEVGGISVKIILIAAGCIAAYLVVSKAFDFWPWPNKAAIAANAGKTEAVAVGQAATEAVNIAVNGDKERENLSQAAQQSKAAIDKIPTNAPPQETRKAVASAVCQLPEYARDPQCIKKAEAAIQNK
jgi:hypothetical protein